MLKAEELGILDRAIAQLGRDSYLGPWLASVRDEVERDIRSDFSPMSDLPRAAYARGATIRADAIEEAKATTCASMEAGRKRAQAAEAQWTAVRAQVRAVLEKLRKVPESM
jgi:hypothetical protein